jgi:hypothetical protein
MSINVQYTDQIVLSIIWGSMLGYGFRHLMKFCEKRDLIDRQSYVAQYVSLALLTVGTTTLLGSDDLLASFVCGTAFAWDGFFNKQTEASVFSSVIDLLLNSTAFVFVGAWMPFNSFSDHELSLSVGRLISIAVLVLLLRRLPIIIGLYKWIPDIKSLREALFSGHFGPIGIGMSSPPTPPKVSRHSIGAIFMSTLAAEMLPRPQSPPANQAELLGATIQPVIAFMVLCSIFIHGLSIPFFSLGQRVTTLTRTWSRQPSLPDWALHTRRVERAEDVVINRDPASMMERGQDNEQNFKKRHPSETTGFDEVEKGARALQREDTAEADALTVAATESETARPDNPPDGTEAYEWKEGSLRIIDWRTGPGEEVCFPFYVPQRSLCSCMTYYRSKLRSSAANLTLAKLNTSHPHLVASTPKCIVLPTHRLGERRGSALTSRRGPKILLTPTVVSSAMRLVRIRRERKSRRMHHRCRT